MASSAACRVPPSPRGGVRYWVTGSTTAKNMRSVPIPAANSIDAHANVLNSGRECSGPSRVRPRRDAPTMITKTRTSVVSRM